MLTEQINDEVDEIPSLILAAEDYSQQDFDAFHRFTRSDERIISRLIAPGPVLLRGSRGSGKSALMREAANRISPGQDDSAAIGVYISLRHLELIRSTKEQYVNFFCNLLAKEIKDKFHELHPDLVDTPSVTSLRECLSLTASALGKRIVLFFDDAAHIGREASLEEFFDIFRTISSTTVSCKAAIYPGVTRFGTRFDVFNDATVIDVSRSEESAGFADFFDQIMILRSPGLSSETLYSDALNRNEVAGFLGRAVLGNVRAFVFACNALAATIRSKGVGLPELNNTLLSLAANHYWPLIEELRPKLGRYMPAIETSTSVVEAIFRVAALSASRTVLIHRDITDRLSKPFEILEYVGFISRRDVSRAMKSGGRGARYALNLCTLMEHVYGTRLTRDLFVKWSSDRGEPVELHRGSELIKIASPENLESDDLEIFDLPVHTLRKSAAYPYGLTERQAELLKANGIDTVRALAESPDEVLLALPYIGPRQVNRFRNVVGQAIWM